MENSQRIKATFQSESSADRDETDSFSKPMPSSMAEDQAQPEASTSSTAAAGVVHWRTEAPPHHEHQPMPAHQYEQYQSGCLLPPAVSYPMIIYCQISIQLI
jgi:hypothetical protein